MKIDIRSNLETHELMAYPATPVRVNNIRTWTVRLTELAPLKSDPFDTILVGTWPSWEEALKAGWVAWRFARGPQARQPEGRSAYR